MRKFIAVIMILMIVLVSGCSSNSSYKSVSDMAVAPSMSQEVSFDSKSSGYYETDGVVSNYNDYIPSEPEYPEEKDKYSTQDNQKLIKTGQISLEVDNATEKYTEITKLLEVNEAYIFNLQEQNYNNRIEMSFTIKVKASNFEKLLSNLKEVGIVRSSNISTQDVTTQYIDTEARIKTLKVQEESLLNIMSKAVKVEDLLRLETELQRVRQQIESNQGQLNYFDNAITYSVINVDISQKSEPTTIIDEDKTIWEKFIFSLKDGLGFWANVLFDIISAILWLLPIIIVGIVVAILIRKGIKKRLANKKPKEK